MTYTDRPELAAHLAGILAQPDDDLRRLVLADWLDELQEGDATARAEFIRVQVRIAELLALGAHEGRSCNVTGHCSECHREGEVIRLRQGNGGEREMLGTAYREWSGPLCELVPKGHLFSDWMTFRRGFLAEVRCTLADWCGTPGIGHAVVAAHPVEVVTITDRRPWFGNYTAGLGRGVPDVFGWWAAHPQDANDYLPLDILDLVAADPRRMLTPQDYRAGGVPHGGVFFAHESTAFDALSAAMIAWAKSLARRGRDDRP